MTANHRVNDAVFTEDGAQALMGRFMYGPLDMVTLTGEKVKAGMFAGLEPNKQMLCIHTMFLIFFLQIDIHIMTQPPSGEWVHFDTELTNNSGRISYVLPESRRLGIGVYPVKMVVRYAECRQSTNRGACTGSCRFTSLSAASLTGETTRLQTAT